VFGTALGGLFSIAFALVYGRWERLGPRGTSALLGLCGFVSICLVPFLKYPPNPPAVGSAETIGLRTGLYVAMVALSLAGMIAALLARGALAPRHGQWNASLLAGGGYLLGMVVLALLLPGIHELPDSFPAPTLWAFRMASLGGHAILWAVIALGFGLLTHRVARRAPGASLGAAIA
jgi:predicted cobalt transporter CbtA